MWNIPWPRYSQSLNNRAVTSRLYSGLWSRQLSCSVPGVYFSSNIHLKVCWWASSTALILRRIARKARALSIRCWAILFAAFSERPRSCRSCCWVSFPSEEAWTPWRSCRMWDWSIFRRVPLSSFIYTKLSSLSLISDLCGCQFYQYDGIFSSSPLFNAQWRYYNTLRYMGRRNPTSTYSSAATPVAFCRHWASFPSPITDVRFIWAS